jgi:hypothetical protein
LFFCKIFGHSYAKVTNITSLGKVSCGPCWKPPWMSLPRTCFLRKIQMHAQ